MRISKGSGASRRQDAIAIVHQMVTALAAALERGIIHRDVKLRNMFLADDSTVKLGDFGLALVEDATTLTTHPMLMGTPAYMSPEQAKGEPATWKSDQYALGICLYELLAGERPFKADTRRRAPLHLHLRASKVPDITVARREVTPATRLVLQRMVAKKPAARFESYDALAAALAGSAIGMTSEYWKDEKTARHHLVAHARSRRRNQDRARNARTRQTSGLRSAHLAPLHRSAPHRSRPAPLAAATRGARHHEPGPRGLLEAVRSRAASSTTIRATSSPSPPAPCDTS